MFSIVYESEEMIERYRKRFKMEKMEISQCPNSIAIEAFKKGIKRDTRLFMELTKTTPCSLDVVYEEALKFVNMEELKPSKFFEPKPSDK